MNQDQQTFINKQSPFNLNRLKFDETVQESDDNIFKKL